MPKSKRDKLVSLTKVKKKTREWKEGLITTVQKLVDEYPNIFVLKYQNMRNDKFKELREELRDSSKFCFGSSKVMKKALGNSEAEEYQQGSSQIAAVLKGEVGLLFTRLSKDQVDDIFSQWEHVDFARAGSRATEDFSLQIGPLENDDGPLSHTLEPLLRKHNLPVKLNRGVVELLDNHTVCKKGQTLSSDQAAILRVFQIRMSKFKMTPIAWWQKSDGSFELLESLNEDDEDSEMAEENEDDFGGVDIPGIPKGVVLA